MLFWNLFIQTIVMVYIIMFIGAGLSWWARAHSKNENADGGSHGA